MRTSPMGTEQSDSLAFSFGARLSPGDKALESGRGTLDHPLVKRRSAILIESIDAPPSLRQVPSTPQPGDPRSGMHKASRPPQDQQTPTDVIDDLIRRGIDRTPVIIVGQCLRAFIMAGREEEGLLMLRALVERKVPGAHRDAEWLRLGPTKFPAALYLFNPARLPWLREQQAELRKEDLEKEARDDAVMARINFEDDDEGDGDEDAEDDKVSELENLTELLLDVPLTLGEGMAEVFQDGSGKKTEPELSQLLEDLTQVDLDQLASELAHPWDDDPPLGAIAPFDEARIEFNKNLALVQAVDALNRRDPAAFRESLALASDQVDWTDWLGYPPIEWLALGKKAAELQLALVPDDFVGWEPELANYVLAGR